MTKYLVSRAFAEVKNITKVLFSSRYLLMTNLGISVSLSATGDIIQQHYEIITTQQGCWDVLRSRNMALSGLTVGFLCHHWYLWLDRFMPGRTLRIVAKKVIVDQLVLSPVQICVFFTTVGVLEGNNLKEVGREIIHKGHHLYLAEWFVWPIAQVINFAILPTRFRVLYDNTISLGFDIYTSYVKHNIPLPEKVEHINKDEK